MRRLLETEGRSCAAIQVRDRFGDYGLVGLVIYGHGREALEVETFLLSCRVLGRGVEHRVVAWLGTAAAARDLAWTDLAFRPSERNVPARSFLESFDAECRTTVSGERRYRLSTARAVALEMAPAGSSSSVGEPSQEAALT